MLCTLKVGLRLVLLTVFGAASLWGAVLKAGVARVDITPPPGLPMYGYFDRRQLSTGTLDPLYARVLVLEVGEKRLALVTLDLGRTFGPASLVRLREAAAKSSGISYLLITASHTHAGPNILDEYPSDQVPAWETAALDKIAKAIDGAHQGAVEAQLGTGYGEVYIGYNRRQVNPDGTVTMLWQNPSKKPTAPLDPTISVLRVDTAEGRPLAILVNYACHPVVFGPDNLQYSADFVGVMAKTVEQAFPRATARSPASSLPYSVVDQPLCFFLQGADGDINPYYATTRLDQDAVKKRDWTGEQLGEAAARVAKRIHTETVPQPSLDFTEDIMSVRVRWNPEKFRRGLLEKFGPKIFEDHAVLLKEEPVKQELLLAETSLLINKRIAMMGMPGEPFVDFQINWRGRCPVPDAFFLGYANGYYDYIPTIRAASEGGYGAADSDTYVGPGTGERMVDHALVRIYQMLGRLTEAPEVDD